VAFGGCFNYCTHTIRFKGFRFFYRLDEFIFQIEMSFLKDEFISTRTDVHMPSHIYIIESRTTSFQEGRMML
jgi:hypothetical protein